MSLTAVGGTLPTAAWLRRFRSKLLKWYDANYRPLPWRETDDPYAIWVSEIMLQQTQVATVIDYYHRFLKDFPDVASLAAADEQEILKLWSGLGYYRRARQLHAAAKVIRDDYSGTFPTSFDEVLSLPGIGRYTAGAIASFAYDHREPILEANTLRLYSRLLGLRDETKAKKSQERLWSFAEFLVEHGTRSYSKSTRFRSTASKRSSPGRLNQALIELGSQVCKPQDPDCMSCPAREFCPTFEQGLQSEIPPPKEKKTFILESHILVVIEDRGRYLMRRNGAGEWWEGLWDFPRTKTGHNIGRLKGISKINSRTRARWEADLLANLNLDCSIKDWIRTIKHGVTKYRISLNCMRADMNSARDLRKSSGIWRWVRGADLPNALPLTSTASKLYEWLRN